MEGHDPDDPVAIYLREVASADPLSKAEEAKLFQFLATSGDWGGEAENAVRRVIESHLRLVVSIAERRSLSSGTDVLDLIQEGNIGLYNAIKAFAKKPVGEFSPYAAACIEDAISKALDKSK